MKVKLNNSVETFVYYSRADTLFFLPFFFKGVAIVKVF